MHKTLQLPFYAKFSLITIGLIGFTFFLIISKEILVPLIFATVISILLNPMVNFLINRGLPRILAIFLVLFVSMMVLIAICYFLGSQASLFSESFPMLKKKTNMLVKEGTKWVSAHFNTSPRKINVWLAEKQKEMLSNSASYVGQTLGTISGILVVILLLPVYIFMILYYKPLILNFIGQLFHAKNHDKVVDVLIETKALIQSYLIGLLVEAAIVAVMNTAALFILGIPYAILLGVLGALLNMIPYIGGIIAIAMPLFLALAVKPPIYLLYVFGAYMLVQFLDNNVIVPRIVASKVKINALASIIVVLVGGAIWGVAGMFLALPLIAIAKVICDRVEALKPFGYLLGDTLPCPGKEFSLPPKE